MTKRRTFLKAAGVGMTAAAMPIIGYPAISSKNHSKTKTDIQLGIASYSLREFPTEQALDMTLRCGIHRITFKSMHLPLDSSEETIRKTVEMCKKKGVELYGGGVIYMKTREDVDQAFRYAKNAQMEMIIGSPHHDLLPYVEEKVKAYDIKLAIHNHGPGDELYPSAESVYEKVKNLDQRMGLCIDIGHTVRIGRDPGQDLKDYFDRVFDVHLKDVTVADADGVSCIIGHGVIDIPSFLHAVDKTGYTGTLALEYEADKDDPLPGMMESLGYVRGVLATF